MRCVIVFFFVLLVLPVFAYAQSTTPVPLTGPVSPNFRPVREIVRPDLPPAPADLDSVIPAGTRVFRLSIAPGEPHVLRVGEAEAAVSAAKGYEAPSAVEGALPIAVPLQFVSAIVPGGPIGSDDSYTAASGSPLSVAAPGFLANDIDLDGEALTATAILKNVQHGSVSAFGDGSFVYTPDPGYLGVDRFVYRMRDASNNFSDSVTVTITVIEGNRSPVGTDDVYTAPSGTAFSVAAPGFLGNDLDPDGEALTATAILKNVQHGSVSAFGDGSFVYTPDPGYLGVDRFVYRMRDASNNFSDSVTVTITVIEGNRAPIGTADSFAVVESQALAKAAPGFLANDVDPDGDTLTATAILENVSHGSLAAFGDGSFTYTPAAGFIGVDSFSYRMRDAPGNQSDTVVVTIDVLPSGGTTPVGIDDAYGAASGSTLSIPAPGFLLNDIDLDGEALTATAILKNVQHGSVSAFGDGSFVYTPDPGYLGVDRFVYRMRDASNNFSDSVTVTITVIEGNRSPVGTDDVYTAPSGMAFSVAAPGFLGNDLDPDGEALTATAILKNVQHGSVSAFGDGSFVYTPDPGYLGVDQFVYRMRDASNNFSDSVTVKITVIEGNRAPVGTDDAYAALGGTPLAIAAPGFLANDVDPDGEALTATSILVNVAHGALSAFGDGSFTYTAAAGFFGVDQFTYRMRDASNNQSDSVTVTITVYDPDNMQPIAHAGSDQTVVVGQLVTLNGAASLDPDGDAITFDWVFADPGPGDPIPFQSEATLVDETTVNPSFCADVVGTYSARLIVNDGVFDSIPDYVTVSAVSVSASLDGLLADVAALKASRALNGGQANALSVKITQAKSLLGKGQTTAAFQVLTGFRAQVTGWRSGKVLTTQQANALLSAVNTIIASISHPCTTTPAVAKGAEDESIQPDDEVQPETFSLSSIYPNPVNATAHVMFTVPTTANVRIVVYDMLGRQVSILADGASESGYHDVVLNAHALVSGTYFVRMTNDDGFSAVKRVAVVK